MCNLISIAEQARLELLKSFGCHGWGFTLDPCLNKTHCKGNRICRSARTLELCKSTSGYCVCLPLDEEKARCQNLSECERGETCFHPEIWQESPACISNVQIPSLAEPQICRRHNDCLPDRTCALVTLSGGYCAAKFKTPGKGSTEQTEDDEVFVVDQTSKPVQPVSIEESTGSGAPKGLEETYLNASVGPNPADSGNNTDNPKNEEPLISIVDEGACIATEALKHLPRSSLLYDKHLYSRVLCDKYGSCATGGHMVRFHSRTMMMKSYCIRTTCDERIMFVNSLRYKRKFLVESSSPGLEFTAFAARFETVFEESILGAAHFIGL